jgi:SAM-dependent methyltransferase
MIASAREKGIDAHVVDGQALPFDAEFDAVVSNAARHWMLDGAAVARGVFRALKPGGRFVGEMGGHSNVAKLRAGLRQELIARGYPVPTQDPQWYPTIEAFSKIYAAAGFIDIDERLIPRPTELPAGVAGWLKTFRAGFMDHAKVPDAEQDAVAKAVEAKLEPDLRRPDGVWEADHVRLRFSMRKPN